MYYVTCLEAPFKGENLISLGSAIVNKKPKTLSSCFSPKLQTFIMKCLEKKPIDRPTIEQLLQYFPQSKEETQQISNECSMISTKDTLQANFKENFKKSTTLVPVIVSSREKSTQNEITPVEQPKLTTIPIESEQTNGQIKEIKTEQQKTRPKSAAVREITPITPIPQIPEEIKIQPIIETKVIRPSTAKPQYQQQPQPVQLDPTPQVMKPQNSSRPASAYP